MNFRDLILLPSLVVLIFASSLYFESQKTQGEVVRYLGQWEEEIAKELLLEKKNHLFEKILGQVRHLQVRWQSSAQEPDDQQCLFPFSVPVSLYGLPARELWFCQPLRPLLMRTILSSHFLGFLVLLVMVLYYLRRENWRIESENEKCREDSRLPKSGGVWHGRWLMISAHRSVP